MQLLGAKVTFARCHIDPMLPGVRPQLAFDFVNMGYEATRVENGILVKCPVKDKEGKPYFKYRVLTDANMQTYEIEDIPEQPKKK